MTVLNDIQIKLAEQLLISIKNHEPNVEYNELASRISPPIHWRQVGKNIGEVSRVCHELGLPLISAKVINKNTHKAGDGFYPLYKLFGIPTNGKTEEELYHEERTAIRECKEWYKLEEYLGLNIGFPKPENTKSHNEAEIKECTLNEISVNVPSFYLSAEAKLLDSGNPKPFNKSVDVLNFAFGKEYLGKYYKNWQKGGINFKSKEMEYTIWFPKISKDKGRTNSSGWYNYFANNSNELHEVNSLVDKACIGVTDNIRFVFTKENNEPYYFAGVFIPDKENCWPDHNLYRKVADKVDLINGEVHIYYYDDVDTEDENLIISLKNDSLTGTPDKFDYNGVAKLKSEPVVIGSKKVYKRDRQTAINALAHAKYKCEIDENHYTFPRKHSGKPYTEPHHLIPMAASEDFEVSLDTEENIVSLCSNCHNQIHYGQGADRLLKKLYDERIEVLKKVGINITFEELLEYYK